jgi:O-acetyl-ADP-ribose deacetylase (regulator of RNase III)
MKMKTKENKELTLQFICEDITDLQVGAIVNAANSYLKHGGGVAGAIVRKGGMIIQKESDEYVQKHGPVTPGNVAVTGPGNLDVQYIIHTVGPIGNKDENDDILSKCLINIFNKASELNLNSIAIPFIGTGIFGYPLERFLVTTYKVVISYFSTYSGSLERVIFCDIDEQKVEKLWQKFQNTTLG